VIPVNPAAHPGINAELGQAFAHWITSLPAQELIASYQVNGLALFVPDSVPWRVAHR
jgi:tungstate transport system substrate-binding protein